MIPSIMMETHRCCDRDKWSEGVLWDSQGRLLGGGDFWALILEDWGGTSYGKIWMKRTIVTQGTASSLSPKAWNNLSCFRNMKGSEWLEYIKGGSTDRKWDRRERRIQIRKCCLQMAPSQVVPQAWPSAEGSLLRIILSSQKQHVSNDW